MKIIGRVIDISTQQPITDVYVHDTKSYSIADDQGNFLFDADENIIYFSRIGWIEQSMDVSNLTPENVTYNGDAIEAINLGNVELISNTEEKPTVEITANRPKKKYSHSWLWWLVLALALKEMKHKK